MRENKGYTLIELIVVIAIMAVVIGGGVLGVSSLASQRVKTSSKKVYNMLGSTQNIAMSKGNTLFAIVRDGNTLTAYTLFKDNGKSDYSVVQSEQLNSAVAVYFQDSAGDEYCIGMDTGDSATTFVDGMVMSIDRATGKFTGTYLYSGVLESPIGTKVGDCTHILMKKSGSVIDITVVPLTGKFFYN
jgi:prepilin-type N-terminal cleavage/methylation domain-containing protein